MPSSVTVAELAAYLETIAPLDLQESYDNAGLLTGDPSMPVTGVLTALDMLEPVIDEAVARGYNVVVAHHPIIFKGLKRLTGEHYVERVVIKAIRAGIALYAIHTNLDSVLNHGVSERIAQRLGLEGLAILDPKPGSDPASPTGLGVLGSLPEAISFGHFIALLKDKMDCSVVRHTAWDDRPIQKVAVCGGSGSFLLPRAMAAQADAFVTADYKYHEFFEADDRILIADIGHYESEQFTIKLLEQLIRNNFSNFASHSTTVITNPVKYS
ncbi:MAG: Nif3-like dinuclear metal center hexameric protein [Saprospiraceae bacterium]|nr:Nif3-like dinuclear metal center hexameric protein [Saprospiraceae bacterium]